MAQRLKHLPGMWETLVQSLDWEDPLEKELATHSNTLAWRIPWREEPGGLIFALSFLYSPTLTFIHDYEKSHSLD